MSTTLTVQFLAGVLALGYAVAGLFFFRFWQQSRDRLFVWFSAAFFILSAQRVLLAFVGESIPMYVLRLMAFALILWAIVDKNRG